MKKLTFLLANSLLTISSFGAFPMLVTTNSSGGFDGPNSWTGASGEIGSVQSDASSVNNNVFVTSFSRGTLTVDPAATLGGLGLDQSRMVDPTGLASEISIQGGGTANMRIDDDGVTLEGFSSTVTGFTVKTTFSNWMSAKGGDGGVSSLPSAANFAMGSALLAVTDEFEFLDSENISWEYSDVRVLTADGTGYVPFGGSFKSSNTTDSFAANSSGGSATPDKGPQNIQTVDLDGDGVTSWDSLYVGDGTIQETERYYYKTVTMTVTIPSGTLSDGINDTGGYSITFDGRQHVDTYGLVDTALLVPEPSSLLLLLSSSAVIAFRRRKS